MLIRAQMLCLALLAAGTIDAQVLDTRSFKMMELAPATEYPSVCSTEVRCAQKDFKGYFWAGSIAAPVALARTSEFLSWQALEDLVRTVAPALENDRIGVKLHYGLSVSGADYNIELAAEVVKIDPRRDPLYYDVSTLEAKVHPIGPTGVFDPEQIKSAWEDAEQKRYLERVFVMRNRGGELDGLVKESDHLAYLLKWEDLVALHGNNEGSTHLNIHCIAAPVIRAPGIEDDWHHDLLVISANHQGVERLTDTRAPGALPYLDKAADLGSPCPPSCVLARFYRYGLAPRTGCKCP
ncbi:MAG: hypothetical protein KA175_08930 [Flavobacteriales bacterium]|nr:hypothetical protein [Flavobacteriales bacterium]